MTPIAADVERAALESVRQNFESKGYKFVADPRPDQLPPFLDGHLPDAIATNAHDHVIIEVKRRHTSQARVSIAELTRVIPPGSGWRYVLVYAGQDPDEFIELSRPKRSQIDEAIKEIHSLQEAGHSRAALTACWSLLEALARRLDPEDFNESRRPLSPIQTVERLAMDGQLSEDDSRRLRTLGSVRNSVVHGDLNVRVLPDDLHFMVEKIELINAQLAHE